MKFPRDPLRFLYWIFFKPISLRKQIDRLDPGIRSVAVLLTRYHDRSIQSLKFLALFYILVMPWLLGIGTGMFLSGLSMDVNWLKLIFYLLTATVLLSTFSIEFCIAFLLPFSVMVAIWCSTSFTLSLGITFSLALGLAYGLTSKSARWGLTAGLVYGVVLGLILDPLSGLLIGAAFLIGYFRIVFYLMEAPLSWSLAILSTDGDALKLWRFNPVLWDELIWFPLPGLDRHLRAVKGQDEPASDIPVRYVRESFRQGWAAERISAME